MRSHSQGPIDLGPEQRLLGRDWQVEEKEVWSWTQSHRLPKTDYWWENQRIPRIFQKHRVQRLALSIAAIQGGIRKNRFLSARDCAKTCWIPVPQDEAIPFTDHEVVRVRLPRTIHSVHHFWKLPVQKLVLHFLFRHSMLPHILRIGTDEAV